MLFSYFFRCDRCKIGVQIDSHGGAKVFFIQPGCRERWRFYSARDLCLKPWYWPLSYPYMVTENSSFMLFVWTPYQLCLYVLPMINRIEPCSFPCFFQSVGRGLPFHEPQQQAVEMYLYGPLQELQGLNMTCKKWGLHNPASSIPEGSYEYKLIGPVWPGVKHANCYQKAHSTCRDTHRIYEAPHVGRADW